MSRVTVCRGPGGCRFSIAEDPEGLAASLETVFAAAFGPAGVGPQHHVCKAAAACCPNGCSRPQIVDVGCLAAVEPARGASPCDGCGACVAACREQAVSLGADGPVIDRGRCLACGECVAACPGGALTAGRRGWRLQVGGKLGRHPRLASEVGLLSRAEVLDTTARLLSWFAARRRGRERLADALEREWPQDILGPRP